jgi:hypothetical protein
MMVSFKIKNTVDNGGNWDIQVSNLHNPSYVDTGCTSCQIKCYIVHSGEILREWTTLNMWETGSGFIFTNDAITSIEITNIPTAVNAVKASLTAKFTVSPKVDSGSTIKITLPSEFPPMGSSVPNPTCTTDLIGASCAITGSYAELAGFTTLSAGTAIEIQINGLKNPTSKSLGAYTF